MQAADLDYTVLTVGPGSFTGLRLGISALKALNLAYGTPVYGIPTLKAYEYSFIDFGLPVVTGIDANKDKFFARIIDGKKKEILKDDDYEIDQIIDCVKAFDPLIAAGPDCLKLKAAISSRLPSVKIITANTSQATTDALFELAEKEITAGTPPMQDYDGPVYLRASEAERKLS